MTHTPLLLARRVLLMLLCGAAAAAQAAPDGEDDTERDGYWGDKSRGWFFYEPKPKKPPAPPVLLPAPVAPRPPADPTQPAKHPDLLRFEALQRRVEDSRNIAIINPTETNIREHLEAQQLALDTAKRFGEASQRVVWATPSLDPAMNGGRPTAPAATSLYDAEKDRGRQARWASLSQTHAFFFFFKSDCPYCHRFAPALRQFSAKSGIQIMPISLDGAGIPDFPDYRADNGIASRLNVTQVPALFLAEPGTGKVLPVGYGVIGPTDLERRIDEITRPDAELVAPSTVKYVGGMAGR
jgi:conjugal transfer pilus assembly protein TraF